MVVAMTACSFTLTLDEALVITPVCKTEGKPRATDWPAYSAGHHHGYSMYALVDVCDRSGCFKQELLVDTFYFFTDWLLTFLHLQLDYADTHPSPTCSNMLRAGIHE